MRGSPLRRICLAARIAVCLLACARAASADDPKPTPENTISIRLPEPVKPQKFSRPIRLYIDKVIDRSGNPQPMLVFKGRGGVFIDRLPTEIVRQSLQESLEQAGLATPDRAAAEFVLNVYVFHFGLAPGSGAEYYGKVDLSVTVKNAATGKSQDVTALGTSIQGTALRKKTLMKNVEENIEEALEAALRNFLRGTKLRDAVGVGEESPAGPPKAASGRLMDSAWELSEPYGLAPSSDASIAARSHERENAQDSLRPRWPGSLLSPVRRELYPDFRASAPRIGP
jgi:hypothetical protein